MRKGKFCEEQMVGILREADREPVAQVAKKHGISEQTIYTWCQRFCGMNADEVKRLRQLEQENSRLKKLLAKRDLEIEVMKEIAAKIMVSAPARRQQAAFASGAGCRNARPALFSLARSTLCYESHMKLRDTPLVALMMMFLAQYTSYGYRRIAVFMRGAQDGAGQGLPALVRGRSPGAEEASAQAGCRLLAPAQRTKFRL